MASNPQPTRGVKPLIDMLDHAVQLGDVEQTTRHIQSELCRLIRTGMIELPPGFHRPHPDRYARRLLHLDDELGYSVVVMTWGPGQGTPIHDHCGMWCVEGVWSGLIEVEQYELTDHTGEHYRFEKRGSTTAGVASVGCLIPPYEYHRIANPDEQSSAVTIHIYGGDMTRCHVFEPEDGAYRRIEKALKLDS